MRCLRWLVISLFVALGAVAAPNLAAAAPFDPAGFHISAPGLWVDESAGAAVVEVDRGDARSAGRVGYIAKPITALRDVDFTAVKGTLTFAPGQASATFRVPIIDHGLPGLPKTINVGLFGPYPNGMATPSNAVLTIESNDPPLLNNVLNPLALATPPPASDPLTGGQAFVDPNSLAANAAAQYRRSNPAWSQALDVIAQQPNVQRYGNWSGPPGLQVSQYLSRASVLQPGTVPELATYYVVDAKRSHPNCGHYADPPWRQGAYHKWISSFAAGIGSYRTVVFLEMDSLITMGCLSRHGVNVRLGELHDAINVLSRLPRTVVYLDAGAADGPARAPLIASYLRRAGVAQIAGFFLNSTHFDWTLHEARYGNQVSALTGGKHFVINTAENGQGPLVPRSRVKYGNEILCNPQDRGLGPRPTFDTGLRNVDAFAWIAYPGRSGGTCRAGAPATGVFWPALAVEFVRNANYAVK